MPTRLATLARQLGRPARVADAALRVEALEERYGISLPADFRTYLQDVAPAEDAIDDRNVTWWGLDRISSLREAYPDETDARQVNVAIEAEAQPYIVFADFLCWCYAYAICCAPGENRGRVALVGGLPDQFVADSFDHFVLLVLADSDRIHGQHDRPPKTLPARLRNWIGRTWRPRF